MNIKELYTRFFASEPKFSHSHLNITFSVSGVLLIIYVLISVQYETKMIRVFNEHTVISDLGIMLFGVTTAVCLYTRYILYNKTSISIRRFLIYTALLSTLLLLDDYFSIHEHWAPNYLNISEKTYYLCLILLVLVYFFKVWITILLTNYIVLLFSLSCFSMSLLGDGILAVSEILSIFGFIFTAIFLYLVVYNRKVIRSYIPSLIILICMLCGFTYLNEIVDGPEYLLEESFKWLGIASWCSYYCHSAYKFIMATIEEPKSA